LQKQDEHARQQIHGSPAMDELYLLLTSAKSPGLAAGSTQSRPYLIGSWKHGFDQIEGGRHPALHISMRP